MPTFSSPNLLAGRASRLVAAAFVALRRPGPRVRIGLVVGAVRAAVRLVAAHPLGVGPG